MAQIPRQQYTKEFREQAVRLVLEQQVPIPEAARRLAMSGRTLERWVGRARQGPLTTLGESRRPVTELEAELSRLKRDLAEARMERDILKKPPRTLRRRRGPVRAHEDAASPLSAESVVSSASGIPKRVRCLANATPLDARPGECTAGSGDPSRPCANPPDVWSRTAASRTA
jgi:transposase